MDEWNGDLSQVARSHSSDSHHFLVAVPSSQFEDTEDSTTDFNAAALRKLPALYPEVASGVEGLMDSKDKQLGSAVLVLDSEVESRQRDDTSDDVHTVEESVSEDILKKTALSVSSSSSDAADVTIIEKNGGKSKDTEPYMLSQEDIFTEKKEDEGRTMHATPSRTVPSLQLSAESMLVQETLDEEDTEICPSPDAYGDVPLIIPNSPTATPEVAGEDCLFNPVGTYTGVGGRHQYRRPQLSHQSKIKIAEGSQSQASVGSPLGQLSGPTLAADMWGNSQSLNLHLTESTSSANDSHPQKSRSLQRAIQRSSAPSASAQSQGFGESQDLRLFLTPQESQPVPNISVSEGGGQQQSQSGATAPEKESPKAGYTSPSHSQSFASSIEQSGRLGGSGQRAPASVDLPHSESQSASETTFKLERPDTSRLNPAEQTEAQESTSEMSIFARTRLGVRHINTTILSQEEESADFLMQKKEDSVNESSSDSIPCSQNWPPVRPESLARPVEEMKERPAENTDVYGNDTVMDSEPEEEEGSTQSYNLFPALSKSPAPPSSVMEEEMAIDDIEVPVLPDTSLSALKLPRPLSQQTTSQGQGNSALNQPLVPTVPENPDNTQNPNRNSQQLTSLRQSQQGTVQQVPIQEAATHSEEEEVSQRQSSNRESERKVTDSGDRGSQQISRGITTRRQSQDVEDTAAGHHMRQLHSNPSQLSQHTKSQDSARRVSSQRASQKKGTASVELPREKGHSRGHSPGHRDVVGVGKETGPSQSTPPTRQLFHPQPDPYLFHGSQSQVQEGTEYTSHAETSVNTMLAHTQHRGMSAWKRKKLMKKKTERNPRGEPEVTSPSTDETTSVKEKPPKATKKGKKGVTKFTKLQKGRNVFKKPQQPKQKLATVPEKHAIAVPETEPQVVQPDGRNPVLPSTSSGVMPSANIQHQVPHAVPGTSHQSSTAGKSGSRQETMFRGLGRKRSVEFADVVQISSPLRPLSGEQSFSDSQSSDAMLEETDIREVVYRVVNRFVTVRRFNTDGKMVDEKTTEEKDDPVVIEENISRKRKIYMPMSPSRSGSTLTSGDLGDISSSSLSNKTSSGPSSLDIESALSFGLSGPERSSLEFFGMKSHLNTAVSAATVAATAGPSQIGCASTGPSLLRRQSEGASESAAAPPSGQSSIVSPAVSTPNQSAIAHDESRHDAVVTSSSSGRNSDPLYSADNLPSGNLPCAQRPQPKRKSSSSSPDVVPPTAQTSSKQSVGLRSTARASSRSTKRMAADSSQEGRRGSKGASPAESQVFQPGSESGGFSVHLSPAHRKGSSTSSLDPAERTIRRKAETAAVRGSGSSDGCTSEEQMSMQVLVQETSNNEDKTPVVIHTASKLVIGARLMARWKDGFFYPATFRGLNTGIGNKFLVRFEDGLEKTVRAIDIILAQHLPIGQSVLVSGEDDLSDPGIVINHVIEGDEVLYEVSMDNRSTKRCPLSKLLLTEDQALSLLSDEDLKVSFGEKDGEQINTADVSLDNVILGKRLRVKGSPAVALPSSLCQPSTSTAASGEEDSRATKSTSTTTCKQSKAGVSDSTQSTMKGRGRRARRESEKDASIQKEANTVKGSGRKRKLGPVATSTPTPKQRRTSLAKQDTPVKPLSMSDSPLGAAVNSPVTQKRPVRKARAGLFEQNTKGPMPKKEDIFEGYSFILTYITKPPEVQAVERSQLKDPLLESSAEESTDEGGTGTQSTPVSFDKDHLTMQIENGGGTVLSKFPHQDGSLKNLFVLSDTYHRTVKYLQALASNIPTVSHRWIIDSCLQNKLLDYKAYVLPAGISLEKHKIMERTNVTCLNGYRILLTSSCSDYLAAWMSILEMAQCKVVIKLPANATRNRTGVDVMVTDAQCVPSLLKKAQQLDIPTVGSEWIIQCLINNTLMDFQGHQAYSHTGCLYTKGETSGSQTK